MLSRVRRTLRLSAPECLIQGLTSAQISQKSADLRARARNLRKFLAATITESNFLKQESKRLSMPPLGSQPIFGEPDEEGEPEFLWPDSEDWTVSFTPRKRI